MKELSQILTEATQAIEGWYFLLNIAGGDPVYRERVYCYELYHQMRSRWPAGCPFFLNGEVDKSAHPILTQLGAGRAKPDFLVHRPGYMEGNHAIIEVKNSFASATHIRTDLRKLSFFLHRGNYQRAIYLVYGYPSKRPLNRISRQAARIPDIQKIELWIHQQAGQPARHVDTPPFTGEELHTVRDCDYGVVQKKFPR
jgi:hypothetical protein